MKEMFVCLWRAAGSNVDEDVVDSATVSPNQQQRNGQSTISSSGSPSVIVSINNNDKRVSASFSVLEITAPDLRAP